MILPAAEPTNAQAGEACPTGRFNSGQAWVFYIAALALAAQLLTAFRYGIFRDELYFIDCSKHLAWGYVDQPPMIAFVTWFERHLTGDSLLSLRFLPALAGALTVWLAGKMVRALGGCRFGQVLAALAVLVAPGYLALFHLLTMNAFDPLIWTACAYVVMRIVQTGDQRLWLWFGALAGIGLENKYGILFFGFGVAVGVLLTSERKALAKPWIWLGACVSLLLWMPNLAWNFAYHWPFLELMRNVRASGRDVVLNPIAFVVEQIGFMNPLTAPIWVCGLVWLFFGADYETDKLRGRYRVLGWTFLVMMVTLIALKGKTYYLWPGFVMLFAAGGFAVEKWINRRPASAPWVKGGCLAALSLAGAILAPITLPVLPPYTFIRYAQELHLAMPQLEHQPLGPLGQQIYADMFGWKEMAQKVAVAYDALPPDVRAKTAIVAGNYGDAGAIDFFGPKLGLPAAISGHQNYWFWGPRDYTGESMIVLNASRKQMDRICDQLQVLGRADDPLSRGDEHFDIYWCRQNKWTLQQVWPRVKHWD